MTAPALAAARREAEEALRRHDTAHWSERGGEDNVYPCITALRALLAALPGDDASAPTTLPPQSGALGYMAKYNASCTDGLPHGDHGLPSEHARAAKGGE